MKWHGWLRSSRRAAWEHAAEGEDINRCHRRLLAEAARRGVSKCGNRALTSGGCPPSVPDEDLHP